MRYIATEEDRKHFCTYDQAQAAIVDDTLPFRSNGETHVALNMSTGHRIPCADAYMAFGYVAGSAAMFPQWKFVIQMGSEQVGPFSPNPLFNDRLRNPNWRDTEKASKRMVADESLLRQQAQAAYDAVMARGLVDEEY
jgi:hypothetical protein